MKSHLWFRRKTYGWGWTPITWQGWAVTAFFLAIPVCIKVITKNMDLSRSEQNFYVLATLPLIVVGLVLVCLRYGERPRWQWGVKITKLAHVELFASNYRDSIIFYDLILLSLGWERMVTRTDYTIYSDGTLKLVLRPRDGEPVGRELEPGHMAFYARTKELVDQFYKEILVVNQIAALDGALPSGDKNYYSIQFLDPDQRRLEVVYAPHYCEKGYKPNLIENNFDPYGQ